MFPFCDPIYKYNFCEQVLLLVTVELAVQAKISQFFENNDFSQTQETSTEAIPII